MPVAELERDLPTGFDVPHEPGWGPGKLMLEIYEKTTEPNLAGPVFVRDYPREVSPLAREHRDDPTLVERFEADRRRPRAGERVQRAQRPGRPAPPLRGPGAAQGSSATPRRNGVDEDYLRALEYGMPPTAAGSASASTGW